MNIANVIVGLILGLRTPFFIVTVVASIWASSRMNAQKFDKKTRVLAWTSFVTSVLISVSYLGEVVLLLKMGSGGNSLMTLLWGAFWAYWSFRSYRTLQKIGAA